MTWSSVASARTKWLMVVCVMSMVLLHQPVTRASENVARAAGTVVVKGSSLAATSLFVPEDARLSLDYYDESPLTGPRFSRGTGLAAVILAPDDSDGARALTAVRLPKAPGQVQRLISLGASLCTAEPEGCLVEKGLYRLILVASSRVTVTMTLEGLPGAVTVHPSEPVAGSISEAAPEYSYELPYTVTGVDAMGIGFAPETTGRAIVFSAFWFRGAEEGIGPVAPADEPLLQVGAAGGCVYFGAPPAVAAFAPGCPQGNDAGTFLTQRALDDFRFLQWGSLGGVPPGVYGLGNYAVHTGIFDPGFIGFWVDAS